jgi:hypothetical protein
MLGLDGGGMLSFSKAKDRVDNAADDGMPLVLFGGLLEFEGIRDIGIDVEGREAAIETGGRCLTDEVVIVFAAELNVGRATANVEELPRIGVFWGFMDGTAAKPVHIIYGEFCIQGGLQVLVAPQPCAHLVS